MARRRTNLGTGEEARDNLLDAAERCIERHGGVEKTTMDDIAHDVGVSRSTLYRYFPDREQLLIALILRRVKRIVLRTHHFIRVQPIFEDRLVEGLIYLARYAYEDPFILPFRRPDGLALADPLLAGAPAVAMTRELWEPFVDAARDSGELRPGLDEPSIYDWLNYIELMVTSRYAEAPDRVDDLRRFVRLFVIPSLADQTANRSLSQPHAGDSTSGLSTHVDRAASALTEHAVRNQVVSSKVRRRVKPKS